MSLRACAGPVRNWEFGSCTDVGTGYWAAASIVNAGSTSTRTACPTGTYTVGYGHGADEANDCGPSLHVGEHVVYMRSNRQTTPSLNIKMPDGNIYYGNMSSANQSLSNLFLKIGATQYCVYDDSLLNGEREF